MAWIESHQELARHPKTKRLARILGISIPTAIGHLHLLWWWALDYAQEGTLECYDESDIADAAMWEGNPLEFVDALCTARFLDRDDNGVLLIHDWYDYAGRLLEKRRTDAERKRLARKRHESIQQTSNGHPTDGAGNRTQPNLTVPNLTIPNQNVLAQEVVAAPEDLPGELPAKSRPRSPFKSKRQEQFFDEFWEQYPKKRSKDRENMGQINRTSSFSPLY